VSEEFEVLHWDDVPFGTGFAVSQFKEGPRKGCWGIFASLPDNRWAWIALGDPAEEVVAPNPVMAQSILTSLRSYSKMKQSAEEMGTWGDKNTSGLPDPRSFPTINWDEVPESVRLQERQFRGDLWWIVASMPDGEHLVILDRFAEDAGYHSFSVTQAEAQGTITWLMMAQTPPDPEMGVAERPDAAAHMPPFVPEVLPDGPLCAAEPTEPTDFLLLASLARQRETDRNRLQELEKEWRYRLAVGKRKSCLCGQCRHEFRIEVTRIMNWYGKPSSESEQDVKELILDAYRLLNLLAVP